MQPCTTTATTTTTTGARTKTTTEAITTTPSELSVSMMKAAEDCGFGENTTEMKMKSTVRVSWII